MSKYEGLLGSADLWPNFFGFTEEEKRRISEDAEALKKFNAEFVGPIFDEEKYVFDLIHFLMDSESGIKRDAINRLMRAWDDEQM